MHPYRQTERHTNIHIIRLTYMNTRIHTNIHKHIHLHTRAIRHTQTYIPTYIHKYIHTYTHPDTHEENVTYMQTDNGNAYIQTDRHPYI